MIVPSRIVTKSRKRRPLATGKQGEKGRFVTLKTGRTIFIPEGKRTKWADVKDKVLAPREEERWGQGGVVSSKPLPKEKRGKNLATLIEFEDGTIGISKTSEVTGSTDAEIMACKFSKSIGWGIIPETVEYEHGGEKGSLQRWVPNSKPIQDLTDADRVRADANARIRVADFVLQSWDRHQGNIVQDDQGKQWAVDNGGAFRVRREAEAGQSPTAYEDISSVGKKALFEGRNYSSAPRSDKAKRELGVACREVGDWRGSEAYKGYLSEVKDLWGDRTAELFDRNMETIAGWGEA